MKLIDKDALVAEIEKRLEELYNHLPDASKVENGMITISEACDTGKYTALESFENYIDTLEVKEVDLEKYYHEFLQKEWFGNLHARTVSEMMAFTAKHFFELGLKAQHSELTWEDISVLRKIMAEYRRQTSNEMLVLNDEDYCKEVLNRFKAQKGEKV